MALLSLTVVIASHKGWAQGNTPVVQYSEYFLDQAPADVDRTKLPLTARNLVVAKVRVLEGPAYLIARDQPPGKDLFWVRAEIVDVLSGTAVTGARYDLYFGVPGVGPRHKYPHTPRQKTRDYFVASYVAEDEMRRLLAFPVSQQEFEKWKKEVREYERTRGRPGARDR
jgi:hypothetical protein